MLTIIRSIVICQPTNFHRLKPIIRLSSSIQAQRKQQADNDHPMKAKDLLFDPNLKKAFDKIKKGDFVPPLFDADIARASQNISSTHSDSDRSASKGGDPREATLGKLVYVGKLDKPFRAAKSLSLASSIGGAICYPIMLPKILQETSTWVAVGYSLISATFVVLTPSLIQLICKRYLTSIYYHEKTEQFTAFYKNFFMMQRQIRFRAEDVQVPPITGVFTSMLINNKPYFVNHEDFYEKHILMKMLGYDKEFDFSKYTKDVQADDDEDGTPKDMNNRDHNRTRSA